MICKRCLVSWSKPCSPQTQIGLDSLCACKEHFQLMQQLHLLNLHWGCDFHRWTLMSQYCRSADKATEAPQDTPGMGSKCSWNAKLFLFARLDPLQWLGKNHRKLFSLSQNSPFPYKPIENTIPLKTSLLNWKFRYLCRSVQCWFLVPPPHLTWPLPTSPHLCSIPHLCSSCSSICSQSSEFPSLPQPLLVPCQLAGQGTPGYIKMSCLRASLLCW